MNAHLPPADKKPWEPELRVDDELARRLIAAQFPPLRDATLRAIGAGWDNAAYLLEEHLVFRFPQRAISAPLMTKELAALPLIAPRVPNAIPMPRYAGRPSDDYPWHFGGYEILLGAPADQRTLSFDDRRRLASDLGSFLRTLHDIDPRPLREAGLPGDLIGKLDPKRLKIDEPPLEGTLRVVHGDLYARHLLLDHRNRLSGIIDWGDVHEGLPAVDLSVVHMMIPAEFHDAFFATYGPVDERAWRFARHRARTHAAFTLESALARGDRSLQQACEIAHAYTGNL
ncbi:MAG TPA: phosphotransferase [Candidatus Acidoferrales bacterium]|nr:phosphotransferase [Candidatus Acidoferrales bacterium]